LLDPAPLEMALEFLEVHQDPVPFDGFVHWSRSDNQPIYSSCIRLASLAHRLAGRLPGGEPERAWVCGLLAPLGWLVMAGMSPALVAETLRDSALATDPGAVQRRLWGVDQVSVVRRIGRYWGLPDWLTGVIANLGLPAEQARAFGADPLLLAVVRQAVRCLRGSPLALPGCHPALACEDEKILGPVDPREEVPDEGGLNEWSNPREVPLLRDLLRLAADGLRRRETALVRRLEWEVDELHRGLEDSVRTEHERLLSGRLAALAEFAGGAGHEINNPLAVISGQAQYLLGHADWLLGGTEGEAGQALGVIIAQTRRIHSLLRDLMQFARPAPARPMVVDLPALLGQVVSSLAETAAARRVRLELLCVPDRLQVSADPEQVRLALGCLLRNAIEAAAGPAEAWAQLRLDAPRVGDSVEVVVEDSGPGPTPAQRPLLFDPFYSGRSAGRGRGLGLPIAWRMARQQGGQVRLEPARPGEPTRFVLTLPAAEETAQGEETPASPASEPREAA
jgi:signal transduction histidine kinase